MYSGSSCPQTGATSVSLPPSHGLAPGQPGLEACSLETCIDNTHGQLPPLSAVENTRDGLGAPLLSPGIRPIRTPGPSTQPLDKHTSPDDQHHLTTHHKPYTHFNDPPAHEGLSHPPAGYQGSFQSCFHYGESYRMEQSVSDVHLPGDSQCFNSHRQNGYPMSISNSSSAGFGAARDLQQFTSSPEESVFFQAGGFDRCLNQISSVYTGT